MLTARSALSDRVAGLDAGADDYLGKPIAIEEFLARLADAQARYRLFLAQAAHQLKTPIMIVRGESALGLERSRDLTEYQGCLPRIHRAAEQMSQRVEGLFLLAHAQAGERAPMNDAVELDGVALECADLMRRRAHALDRTLNLEHIEQVQISGNEALVREALLELIENALRHRAPGVPVALSAYRDDGHACTEVLSAGPSPIPRFSTSPAVRCARTAAMAWVSRSCTGSRKRTAGSSTTPGAAIAMCSRLCGRPSRAKPLLRP